MKKSIGIFEAKTHFTKIISQVMSGEEIFITRRGKTVAKIIPIEKTSDKELIQSTILRIQNLAKSMQLGNFSWNEWKNYRDEGRH